MHIGYVNKHVSAYRVLSASQSISNLEALKRGWEAAYKTHTVPTASSDADLKIFRGSRISPST